VKQRNWAILGLLPPLLLTGWYVFVTAIRAYPAERWVWNYTMNALVIVENNYIPIDMPRYGAFVHGEWITYYSTLYAAMNSIISGMDITQFYTFAGSLLLFLNVVPTYLWLRELFNTARARDAIASFGTLFVSAIPFIVLKGIGGMIPEVWCWPLMSTSLFSFHKYINSGRRRFLVISILTLGAMVPGDLHAAAGVGIYFVAFYVGHSLANNAWKPMFLKTLPMVLALLVGLILYVPIYTREGGTVASPEPRDPQEETIAEAQYYQIYGGEGGLKWEAVRFPSTFYFFWNGFSQNPLAWKVGADWKIIDLLGVLTIVGIVAGTYYLGLRRRIAAGTAAVLTIALYGLFELMLAYSSTFINISWYSTIAWRQFAYVVWPIGILAGVALGIAFRAAIEHIASRRALFAALTAIFCVATYPLYAEAWVARTQANPWWNYSEDQVEALEALKDRPQGRVLVNEYSWGIVYVVSGKLAISEGEKGITPRGLGYYKVSDAVERLEDTITFYKTPDPVLADQLIKKWDIKYVVVWKDPPPPAPPEAFVLAWEMNLAKLSKLPLTQLYDSDNATVYEVVPGK
jgi:hypothetical protein